MKPRLAEQRNRALTLIEVVVIIGVLALLAALLLPALAVHHPRWPIYCAGNLKQISVAYRLWEGDHNGKYPMVVSVTNGGAMELVATGNVAACFRVMSNELSTPKILVCPEDSHRKCATNFFVLKNSNLSYFIGADITNDDNPYLILSGDDNLAIGGVPVKSGILLLPTNAPVAWAKVKNRYVGNFGMADGSVQQIIPSWLKKTLAETGVATNRLAIP